MASHVVSIALRPHRLYSTNAPYLYPALDNRKVTVVDRFSGFRVLGPWSGAVDGPPRT